MLFSALAPTMESFLPENRPLQASDVVSLVSDLHSKRVQSLKLVTNNLACVQHNQARGGKLERIPGLWSESDLTTLLGAVFGSEAQALLASGCVLEKHLKTVSKSGESFSFLAFCVPCWANQAPVVDFTLFFEASTKFHDYAAGCEVSAWH